MTSQDFTKQLLIGTGQDGRIFVDVVYHDGKLSLTGVEGPLANGDARGSCGQLTIDPAAITEFAESWTVESAERLAEIWKRWHLNDMRPGCEHQRAEKWAERPIDPNKPTRAYGKHFEGQRTDSWNMLAWVTHAEHPEGLLSRPCGVCGYKYGSAWLREDVPTDVLEWLRSLPEASTPSPWGPPR